MWPLGVAARVANPAHGGNLAGASRSGQARDESDRFVSIALWCEGDRVQRARWKATTCPALMAYAELACELLESGQPPDAATLRARLPGVHPIHRSCADLVQAAVAAALVGKGESE
jgi:hypothetical protein